MKDTTVVNEAIQAYIIPSGDAHQVRFFLPLINIFLFSTTSDLIIVDNKYFVFKIFLGRVNILQTVTRGEPSFLVLQGQLVLQ